MFCIQYLIYNELKKAYFITMPDLLSFLNILDKNQNILQCKIWIHEEQVLTKNIDYYNLGGYQDIIVDKFTYNY